MKQVFILIFFISCSAPKELPKLSTESCEDFYYGKIETKRILSDEDKLALTKKGIYIQQAVFEYAYLGVWRRKINLTDLSKTAIKSLRETKTGEKLTAGISAKDFEELTKTHGTSVVLMNTISKVNDDEISEFGQIMAQQQGYYKLNVSNSRLQDILEYPCLRTMTVLREMEMPDIADSVKQEKVIKSIKDN